MDKRIEKGCRAVFINSNSSDNGTIVTVGDFLGGIAGYEGERWKVDTKIVSMVMRQGAYTGEVHSVVNHVQGKNLKRIDDEEPSWETIESITKWNPNKDVVHG